MHLTRRSPNRDVLIVHDDETQVIRHGVVARRFIGNFSRRSALAFFSAGITLGGVACEKAATVVAPPPSVQVMEIKTSSVPLSADFIGQLDSPQNVEVRARVEAFVDKVLFTEGTEIKAGDALFTLDKKPFMERLAAAEGMLAEAKAATNKYEKDVARLKPLAEKRAIPRQDLDNAIASVDVGKANVLSAEARVESAKLELGYCDVKSPVAGLIGAKLVSVGSLVGKGDATLLATVSQLDPIWFYTNLSEVEYLRADAEVRRTGKQFAELGVRLTLADGSVHPSPGKIVFIDRAVDVKTGTLRFRAEFANPQKSLRPGMFARIKVDVGAIPDGILVPERAVVELQGRNFVWVIDSENKASQRPVKVGARIGSDWVIQEGLKPGGRIIVEGVQKAREGGVIKAIAASGEAAQAAVIPAAAAITPKIEKE